MKTRGIIKDRTIHLDHPIDLPEGQPPGIYLLYFGADAPPWSNPGR